jgi:hypothetical protein
MQLSFLKMTTRLVRGVEYKITSTKDRIKISLQSDVIYDSNEGDAPAEYRELLTSGGLSKKLQDLGVIKRTVIKRHP